MFRESAEKKVGAEICEQIGGDSNILATEPMVVYHAGG